MVKERITAMTKGAIRKVKSNNMAGERNPIAAKPSPDFFHLRRGMDIVDDGKGAPFPGAPSDDQPPKGG
ncbi:hypothetical protein ACVNPS_01355 [Candidatus Bipolaricaulota sp. J31]